MASWPRLGHPWCMSSSARSMAFASRSGSRPSRSILANANVGTSPVVGHDATQTSCPCVTRYWQSNGTRLLADDERGDLPPTGRDVGETTGAQSREETCQLASIEIRRAVNQHVGDDGALSRLEAGKQLAADL